MDKQKDFARYKTVLKYLLWLIIGAFIVYSFQAIIDLDWIASPGRDEGFRSVLSELTRPNIRDRETVQMVAGEMLDTFQIGFLSTAIGAVFAIPFTLLSARPSSNWGRGFNILLQPILSAIRSAHPLITTIFAVILAGIGPTAGVLALTLYSTAVLIGNFSEYAQQHPTLNWANLLKVHFPGLAFKQLPVSILIATILGFTGGGAIGFFLYYSFIHSEFRDMSVAIIACIITIGSMDLVSRAVWRQIQKNSEPNATISD